jgi:hypothetical protein
MADFGIRLTDRNKATWALVNQADAQSKGFLLSSIDHRDHH